MSAQVATLILAWVAILLLGLGLAGILRRVQVLELRVSGDIGQGGRLGARAPVMDVDPPFGVLFFESGCSVCESSIVAVEEILSSADSGFRDRVVGVLAGPDGEEPYWWHPEVFGQTASGVLSSEFGVRAFPWVIAVDRHNVIAFDGPLAPNDRVEQAFGQLRRLILTGGPVEKGAQ